MRPTVYIETTIVSYLTSWPSRDVIRLSHEILTHKWWMTSRSGFDLYTSDFTVNEASQGDTTAAAERIRALQNIPLLPIDPKVDVLAEQLARVLNLPARSRIDAVHVAVAAFHGVAFLLTWNCRHLANGTLTDKIDQTCSDAGYVAPRILMPELLMELP